MKKTILFGKIISLTGIICIFGFLLYSCKDKPQKQLIFTASSFSVIKKDILSNMQDTVLSKIGYNNRIYDILEWEKDSLLFITIRNERLKLVIKQVGKFKSQRKFALSCFLAFIESNDCKQGFISQRFGLLGRKFGIVHWHK
jgi:hypothetical protein